MQFSKLNDNTIRITETKPIITDYNIEELLAKKSEYEATIQDIDNRIVLATQNWKNEQDDCLSKIAEIDAILSQCEKLNIKVEKIEAISLSEDKIVPIKEEI